MVFGRCRGEMARSNLSERFPELRPEPRALARADFHCRQALAFREMWHTKTGFVLTRALSPENQGQAVG